MRITKHIRQGSVLGMEDFFLYEVEDFLEPMYFSQLKERAMLASKYRYGSPTSYVASPERAANNKNVYDHGQFVYTLLYDGRPVDDTMLAFVEPLLYKVYDLFDAYTFHGLHRAKINILQPVPNLDPAMYNLPHADIQRKTVHTGVLYLTGSDGDIVIFKERFENNEEYPEKFTEFMRITPKENTLVFFNSGYYHASSNPKQTGARCALNLIFDATDKEAVYDNAQRNNG